MRDLITVYTIWGKRLRVSNLEYKNQKIKLLSCYNNRGKLVSGRGGNNNITCSIRRRELFLKELKQ